MTKKIAAFFDIDGTLVRTSLMLAHFERLVSYDIIEKTVYLNDIKPKSDEYHRRFLEYDNYLDIVSELYMKSLKGLKYDLIDYSAKQVVERNSDVVYTYTRDRIRWHQDNGHLVFFISGSPEFLVRHMAEKYRVTNYKGTIYKTDEDDYFTGDYIKMWDAVSKDKIIDEFSKEYDIGLEKSYSYGDTNGDISMLKRVGNPVAINPSSILLALIKDDEKLRHKVNIMVERKDVIYKINPEVETYNLDSKRL